MDLLNELYFKDDLPWIEEKILTIYSKICDLYSSSEQVDENIFLKLETLYMLLQFWNSSCGSNKKILNNEFSNVFDVLLSMYFKNNDLEFSVSKLLIKQITQCFILSTSYEPAFRHCNAALLNQVSLFLVDQFVVLSEGKKDFSIACINKLKIVPLLEKCEEFPESFLILLLKLMTKTICENLSYSEHFYQCLALLEILLLNASHKLSVVDMTSSCILPVSDIIQSSSLSVWKSFFNDDDVFQDNSKEKIIEKAAVGISLLEPMLKIIQNTQHEKLEIIFFQVMSDVTSWFMLQVGGYHKVASVRKKTCKILLDIVHYLNSLPLERIDAQWQNIKHTENAKGKLLVDSFMDSFQSVNIQQTLLTITSYIKICQLLEETQSHVVLPNIKSINLYLTSNIKENNFSFSWNLSILLRMFEQECRDVQCHGLALCFESEFAACLVNHPFWYSFMFNGLMELLHHDYIYLEYNQVVTDYPTLSLKLRHFFVACCENSGNLVRFIKAFLKAICWRSWSQVSFLYICETLLFLPSTKGWDSSDYPLLRKAFTDMIKTFNPTIKKVIQKTLLGCLKKHISIGSFHILQVISLLSECIKCESLTYGSLMWNEISDWFFHHALLMMQDFGKIDDIGQLLVVFIEKCFQNVSSNTCAIPFLMESGVLCYTLLVDGMKLNCSNSVQEAAQETVTLVSDVLSKAVVHIYMPQYKINSALTFINHLCQLKKHFASNEDTFVENLVPVFMKMFSDVSKYIRCKLLQENRTLDEAKLYLTTLEELLKFLQCRCTDSQASKLLLLLKPVSEGLIKDIVFASKMKSQPDAAVVYSFSFFWCLKITHECNVSMDTKTVALVVEHYSSIKLTCDDTFAQNKHLMSQIVEYNWSGLPYVLSSCSSFSSNIPKILNLLRDQFDVTPHSSLVQLFLVAKHLFARVNAENSCDTCALCIERMLQVTLELCHSSTFRPLFYHFVDAAFQSSTLGAETNSNLGKTLKAVLQKLIVLSQNKIGMLKRPLLNCLNYWLRGVEVDEEFYSEAMFLSKVFYTSLEFKEIESNHLSAINYVDFILHCLTYSPVTTKDTQSIKQALSHASMSSGESYRDEFQVSLFASSLLLRLNLSSSEHVTFANQLLDHMIGMDNEKLSRKVRCHLLSFEHYVLQKLWQNFILLVPMLKSEKSNGVINYLILRLDGALQDSVRYVIEWSLVLLLTKFPESKKLLFDKLHCALSKTSSYSSICSYLTILLLDGLALSDEKAQKEYFINFVNSVIPWCMNQQFSIRLYAHAILHRISKHFKAMEHKKILEETFPWLNCCIDFANKSSGNTSKNWQKICQHFMLFNFDPIGELSLETIFISIPRLCGLEAPRLEDLKKAIPSSWWPHVAKTNVLRSLQASKWQICNQSVESSNHDSTSEASCLQRKIVVDEKMKKVKVQSDGLVLVASLLSKPSNLGGLARTCEIFAAERLVVPDLNCINDPAFQALSVSAHKWLKMEEVRPRLLKKFLLNMKKDGYTVVGAEQTDRSKLLNQFKFPLKTVILLGSEKEGIPRDLLSLSDVCVEIPQLGVIRSLNVHVSAAIAVWEYRKQIMENS